VGQAYCDDFESLAYVLMYFPQFSEDSELLAYVLMYFLQFSDDFELLAYVLVTILDMGYLFFYPLYDSAHCHGLPFRFGLVN